MKKGREKEGGAAFKLRGFLTTKAPCRGTFCQSGRFFFFQRVSSLFPFERFFWLGAQVHRIFWILRLPAFKLVTIYHLPLHLFLPCQNAKKEQQHSNAHRVRFYPFQSLYFPHHSEVAQSKDQQHQARTDSSSPHRHPHRQEPTSYELFSKVKNSKFMSVIDIWLNGN